MSRALSDNVQETPLGPDDSETCPASRLPRLGLPYLSLVSSERRLLLTILDVLVLSSALVMAVALRTDWATEVTMYRLVTANWKWFATLAIFWLAISAIGDVYDLARCASAPHSMLSANSAAAATILLYHFTPWLTPPLDSRGLVFFFAGFALLGLTLWRGLYAVLFAQPTFQLNALILGAGEAGRTLASEISAVPMEGNPYRGSGYRIMGFVDDDTAKQGSQVAGIPVLGTSTQLLDLAASHGIQEIVLAITHRHSMSDQALEMLLTCRERGLRITTMPALYEELLGRIPVHHVGRDLGAVLPTSQGSTDRLFWLCKRIGDWAVGAVGTLCLGLALPWVALLNLIWSRGPLFYRQERVGKGGRIFQILKFRTMVPDAEQATGPVWSEDHDPRITPVGHWLRKTRLDELPQIINVFRGEMSLVGPRPERPEFVEKLCRDIPFYRARHAVRPGITGWAQVRYGYGNSVDDARIKLEYDLYYVKHAGFYLDTLILLKTLAVIFKLQGK